MGKIFDEIQEKLTTQNKNLYDITDEIARKKAIFERKMGNYYKEKHSALMEIKDTLQKPIPVRVGDFINELTINPNIATINITTNIKKPGIVGKETLLENPFFPYITFCGLYYKNIYGKQTLKPYNLSTPLPNFDSIQVNGMTLKEMASVKYEGVTPDVPTHSVLHFSKDLINDIVIDIPYITARDASIEDGPNFLDIIAKCEYDKDSYSTQEKADDAIME